jgi:hypothetical protein
MTRQITPKTKLQQERQKEHSSVFSVFSMVAKVIKKKKELQYCNNKNAKPKHKTQTLVAVCPGTQFVVLGFFLPPLFCHSLTHTY